MEWNQICLWTVVAVCGTNLFASLRASPPLWGWATVAGVILAGTGAAYLVRPEVAGLGGGAFVAALIIAPAVLQRFVARWAFCQRYDRARWPAALTGFLHPFDGLWQQARLIRALDSANRGDPAGADALLASLSTAPPRVAAAAQLHRCRLSYRWADWIAWADGHIGWGRVRRDPGLLNGYVRGLGEVGRLADMLLAAAGQRLPSHPVMGPHRALCRMTAFAFAGRPGHVATLLAGPLADLPAAVADFWLATAELAAGSAAGDKRLAAAARSATPGVAAAIAHRRANPPAVADDTLTPVDQLVLDELARDGEHELRFATPVGGRWRPWVTYGLVAANAAVFAVEVWRGGPAVDESARYDRMLRRMGAIARADLGDHAYWRLLAANFLHYGSAHVVMNMLALVALGPMVERSLGRTAYAVVYLASGTAAVATAAALQTNPHEVLVGASGAIMAMVGATAAVLARGWFRERAATAARRLRVTIVIVAVQAAFDYFTPQVSGVAHLSGVAYGFILASLLPHQSGRRPTPVPTQSLN